MQAPINSQPSSARASILYSVEEAILFCISGYMELAGLKVMGLLTKFNFELQL